VDCDGGGCREGDGELIAREEIYDRAGLVARETVDRICSFRDEIADAAPSGGCGGISGARLSEID
jgi:hypothetical protein